MRREANSTPLTPKRRFRHHNHWIGFCGCWLPLAMSMSLFSVAQPISSWAQINQAPGHISTVLELPLEGGKIPKILRFPVYEQNSVHYFSGGLGKEERSLTYPSYPLKLIFVQGKRAFLAGITVGISEIEGKHLLTIPGEEVQGPWLFVDLPTGTYSINGTNTNGTTIQKTITISHEKTTIVHFRWP